MGYWEYIGGILGLYRDNGKENGNYYNGVFPKVGCRQEHDELSPQAFRDSGLRA